MPKQNKYLWFNFQRMEKCDGKNIFCNVIFKYCINDTMVGRTTGMEIHLLKRSASAYSTASDFPGSLQVDEDFFSFVGNSKNNSTADPTIYAA
jgi:hypothetical protein